jgi:signal transduction histidine kinase
VHKAIHLHYAVPNDTLVLVVRDEGIGIPQNELKYLFDRFFRASNVTNIQGTGLGLNIVKRYVDLLAGEIEFTSENGKGSTFTVTLPLL